MTSPISYIFHRVWFSCIPNTLRNANIYNFAGIWDIFQKLFSVKVRVFCIKNEKKIHQKSLNSLFWRNAPYSLKNRKICYVKKTEILENVIRFSISVKFFEWFSFKHTLFFTDFSDFSSFLGQLTSPVRSNFLKITVVSRKWSFLTRYAIASQYIEENMVNYLKNGQKTAVFDEFWRFQYFSTDTWFLDPWRHALPYFSPNLKQLNAGCPGDSKNV